MQHTRVHFLLHFISPHDEYLRNRRKRIMRDDTLNVLAEIAKRLMAVSTKHYYGYGMPAKLQAQKILCLLNGGVFAILKMNP